MNTEKDINAISSSTVHSSQVPLSLLTRSIGHGTHGGPSPKPSHNPPARIQSERGHHMTDIQPLAKHSGRSVATFFNGLFTTIIALGTLGTSITFSFVLSNQTIPPEDGSYFDAGFIQFFLAISWLLFLLALATASLGSTLLTFFRKHWVRDWDGEHGRHSQLCVQLYAVGVSAIMGGLIVAAFVFMCLVVVAYQPAVGWVSLGFTSLFGVIVVGSIGNQVPWPWIQPRTPNTSSGNKESFA